ncbi:Inositol monophosphatase 1 [Trichoplax sp. H2]|uniref:Inositol-1-monophosphatase n=1 Tax=Trichoplax adhaerens TaxID=10228 RepID=B3RIZ8_TRIAD|nr:hypothetical protein TRIADDRAFT_52515 [Trichoplax adhaerens]EDV29776.1 hypothetical protein TRIADDRAFT_52515 [Trichoplax adhaerens]RDD47112.1 Inositol monophosphatase 1 [Trichoplax sp. H2]|eukprot:XP_002108978.1 hypothetical protein TRIADDRAFT_52515 [Trichoplax adhaerens]
MDQLGEYLETCEQVARTAGQVIKKAYSNDKTIMTKSCSADLVTQTDQEVEKLIISTLRTKYPTHCFIGEESSADGQSCQLTDKPTWIIDPLDGTTNFVHRIPFVAVSIALKINKKTEIAAVYSCILDEMFTARLGHGAFCNGKNISVSNQTNLNKALVISEYGSSRDQEIIDSIVANMRGVISKPIPAHGIRCLGSAALNMCQVARGGGDAYFETGIHCWDMAAGDLIVREAGGVVIDTRGGELDIMARRVLCASTESLANEIIECTKEITMPRDDE